MVPRRQVDAFGETRDYQGLAVMGGARFEAFELSGHVPFYRIELGPESHAGLGDVHAEAGWIALADSVEAGLSLAVMPPLGDDEFGLAMGHWMVMAGTEVQGALASRVVVWRAVGVTASAAAATPIGDGEFLALVGGGVSAQVGRMEASLEASHGSRDIRQGWS